MATLRITVAIVLAPFFLLLIPNGCFAGAGFAKGGSVHSIFLSPEAVATHGASYEIICPVPGGEDSSSQPRFAYLKPDQYEGGCEQYGQHSTFYLLNFFRVTPPLNPEFAISTAVQKVEGDNMVNLRAWHETHYYTVLGRVSVFKVKGDVIRYLHKRGNR